MVLQAIADGLREYEIGPHAATRLLQAIADVRPDLIDAYGLPEAARTHLAEVAVEDLADCLEELIEPLRDDLRALPPAPAAIGRGQVTPAGYRSP